MNSAGFNLIKSYEKYREFPYPDPASPLAKATAGRHIRWGFSPPQGLLDRLDEKTRYLSGAPWTKGYGQTKNVELSDRVSEHEASVDLMHECQLLEEQIREACTVVPNENQLAAMISLAYNIGMGWKVKTKGSKDGFRQSSVLRAHNAGDFDSAARAFRMWNKAGGVEMAGLTRRRLEEAQLYLTPVMNTLVAQREDEPLSQQFSGESGARSSPIIWGSTVAGTSGTAAMVVRDVSTIRDQLGEYAPYVFVVAALVAAGCVIYYRIKQRRKGFV